jgi:hypothetical protein
MAFYENLSFADMAKGEGGSTVEREEELTYTEQVCTVCTWISFRVMIDLEGPLS